MSAAADTIARSAPEIRPGGRRNRVLVAIRLLTAVLILVAPPAAVPSVATQSGHPEAVASVGSGLASETVAGPPPDGRLVSYEQIQIPERGIVNAIHRDRTGFLWFGSTRGLYRYDGYRVRSASLGDTTMPARRIVNALLGLEDGRMLVGTGSGLLRFDPSTERHEAFPPDGELAGARIVALSEGPRRTLWLATAGGELYRCGMDGSGLRRFGPSEGLTAARVTVLHAGASGRLWAGTLDGSLFVYDSVTGRFDGAPGWSVRDEPASAGRIAALLERSDRDIWVGTDFDLFEYNAETRVRRRILLPSDNPHTIAGLAAGSGGDSRIWIGISELGLFMSSGARVERLEVPGDAARILSTVRTVYADPAVPPRPEALLWVGTRHGVIRIVISPNPFHVRIRGRDGLQLGRGAVLSLLEDHRGVLWVGLWGGGLHGMRRGGNGYSRIASVPLGGPAGASGPSEIVGWIEEDRGGTLWAGTHSGLVRLDRSRSRVEILRHDPLDSTTIIGDVVTRVYFPGDGSLWATTTKGISVMDRSRPGVFRHLLHDPGDAHAVGGNEVSDLHQTSDGAIWATTYGRGLQRISPGRPVERFRFPGDDEGTRENFMYDVEEDSSGLFWLSTQGGLLSFEPATGEFRAHPIAEVGLAHIFGIAPDGSNRLWLSTGVGLVRYEPSTRLATRYEADHGLPFQEFFSGFARGRGGRLLAGGIDGWVEFDPAAIPAPAAAPAIVITGAAVFDDEVPQESLQAGVLRLSHDQNFFSFTFAALDYANPSRNRFVYRMEGVDERWIESGTRNFASYTNLDPGSYTFRVRGASRDNNWDDRGASLAIVIEPPVWREWWFLLGAACLAAAGAYAGYRARLRSALALERLRLRIADDLHDDVGSNLGAIAMMSRAGRRQSDGVDAPARRLERIHDIAVRTSEGLRDIVWFVKPVDDTLDDLLLRMKDAATAILRDLPYDFRAPAGRHDEALSIEFRRNVFLAFKEMMTNAARHSGASKVEIDIGIDGRQLDMAVADDGNGFDPDAAHRGSGVASLRKRAAALGGRCMFTPREGRGTVVRFTAPLS